MTEYKATLLKEMRGVVNEFYRNIREKMEEISRRHKRERQQLITRLKQKKRPPKTFSCSEVSMSNQKTSPKTEGMELYKLGKFPGVIQTSSMRHGRNRITPEPPSDSRRKPEGASREPSRAHFVEDLTPVEESNWKSQSRATQGGHFVSTTRGTPSRTSGRTQMLEGKSSEKIGRDYWEKQRANRAL